MAEVKKVERMKCIVSCETPQPGGGFVRFEAGKEYPVSLVPGGSPNFEPVVERSKKAGEKEDVSNGDD